MRSGACAASAPGAAPGRARRSRPRLRREPSRAPVPDRGGWPSCDRTPAATGPSSKAAARRAPRLGARACREGLPARPGGASFRPGLQRAGRTAARREGCSAPRGLQRAARAAAASLRAEQCRVRGAVQGPAGGLHPPGSGRGPLRSRRPPPQRPAQLGQTLDRLPPDARRRRIPLAIAPNAPGFEFGKPDRLLVSSPIGVQPPSRGASSGDDIPPPGVRPAALAKRAPNAPAPRGRLPPCGRLPSPAAFACGFPSRRDHRRPLPGPDRAHGPGFRTRRTGRGPGRGRAARGA